MSFCGTGFIFQVLNDFKLRKKFKRHFYSIIFNGIGRRFSNFIFAQPTLYLLVILCNLSYRKGTSEQNRYGKTLIGNPNMKLE